MDPGTAAIDYVKAIRDAAEMCCTVPTLLLVQKVDVDKGRPPSQFQPTGHIYFIVPMGHTKELMHMLLLCAIWYFPWGLRARRS